MTGNKNYRIKRTPDEVKLVETSVWVCSNRECKCWQRQAFSLSRNPQCPLCHSEMTMKTKDLPEIGETASAN